MQNIHKINLAIVLSATLVVTTVIAIAENQSTENRTCYSIGPDVVSRFWDSKDYGSLGEFAAFSFGTDACNIGDEVLDWVGATADHPVISTALYRLKNSRFEQVGISWVKHGFAAAQSPNRCDCECDPPNDYQHLGIGCADAYSASTNGIQQYQGPRSEVDGYTGLFPFPPNGFGEGGDTIFKRLQVNHADLESSSTEAQYFGEIQYVSAHDSLFGNQFNNSTWQPITVSGIGDNWSISISGEDRVGDPVLRAWAEVNSSVRLTESQPPTDGLILVAALISPVNEGWYQYEYAIQNVNAHRGVRELTIEIPIGGIVRNIGFHDISYHSGETVEGTDWEVSNNYNSIKWTTSSFSDNPMANAIRWGTTYNFRFISNVPPTNGGVSLTHFRDGFKGSESISTRTPNLNIDPCKLAPSLCPTDINLDGTVNVSDLLVLFDWWGDCGDGTYKPPADTTGDCCVDISDALAVINDWGVQCGFGGACCLPDESCTVSNSQLECELLNGSWIGDITTCESVSCDTSGSCCLTEGLCTEKVTIEYCIGIGGTWRGVGSTCDGVTCSAGSDNCEYAPTIGDGIYFVDTTNATTDGPNHEECITGGDNGQTGNDRWFTYIPDSDGQLTVSTCEQVGGSADYDTDLVIYDGADCDNLVLLDCNDDTTDYDCGNEKGGWHSNVVVPVTQGSSYLIRLGSWQEGNVGTAELFVEFE